jgi:uncharacterized membrane protein YeiH
LLLVALLIVTRATLLAVESVKLTAKPNNIIILADDLGFGDLSCTGAMMGYHSEFQSSASSVMGILSFRQIFLMPTSETPYFLASLIIGSDHTCS